MSEFEKLFVIDEAEPITALPLVDDTSESKKSDKTKRYRVMITFMIWISNDDNAFVRRFLETYRETFPKDEIEDGVVIANKHMSMQEMSFMIEDRKALSWLVSVPVVSKHPTKDSRQFIKSRLGKKMITQADLFKNDCLLNDAFGAIPEDAEFYVQDT